MTIMKLGPSNAVSRTGFEPSASQKTQPLGSPPSRLFREPGRDRSSIGGPHLPPPASQTARIQSFAEPGKTPACVRPVKSTCPDRRDSYHLETSAAAFLRL